MKRNRITSALLTCFLVFLLAGMYEQPVYAVKPSEVGFSVSDPTRSYDNKTGQFGMKITLKNQSYKEMNITVYLYNADGKCVTKWNNGGNGYSVDEHEELTKNFIADYTKFPSSSYTFLYQVKVYSYYNEKKREYEDLYFKWKWTITKEEACGPSISFKKATLHTRDNGSVVPRINYNCRNIKGQTLNIYIYDEYDDLVYEIKAKERPSNNENNWFSWNGKDDGDQQYPDGNYTVKIVSSGGVSVSKKFYLDFPYNNK